MSPRLNFIVLSFRLRTSSLHPKIVNSVLNLRALCNGVEICVNVRLVDGFQLDGHWLLRKASYCVLLLNRCLDEIRNLRDRFSVK